MGRAKTDGKLPAPIVRHCNRCSTLKPLKDFSSNPDCHYGKAYTCKACVAQNSRRHYLENIPRKLKLANERNRRTKDKAIDYLGGKCQDCAGIFHRCCYDFHHVDGTKELNPSKALSYSWDKAVEELKKCVLLCSNCHRMRHFKEVEEDEGIN